MSLRVLVLRNPFTQEREEMTVDGGTVGDCIEAAQMRDEVGVVSIVGDQVVGPDYVPEDGETVILRAVPRGSNPADAIKNTGVVMTIVSAVSIVAGIGLIATGVGAVAGVGLISAGVGGLVGGIGMIVTGANFPDIDLDVGGADVPDFTEAPGLRGSRNSFSPGAVIPLILGRHHVVPPLGAKTYVSYFRNDARLHQLFVTGYSPLEVSEFRIGETDLSSFDSVFTAVSEQAFPLGIPYSGSGGTEFVNATVEYGESPVERQTPDDIDRLYVTVAGPRGFVYFASNGDTKNLVEQFKITILDGTTEIDSYPVWLLGSGLRPVRANRWITLPQKGSYTIRVEQVTNVGGNKEDEGLRVVNHAVFDSFRAYVNDDPVSDEMKEKINRIGLRIQAENQLFGVVDRFNLLAEAKYKDFNGSTWSEAKTRNPASAFLRALQGPHLEPDMVVPDSEIDWQSLEEWHQWCDSKGFECNAVVDRGMPLERLLNNIASTGRASWSVQDGKYRIIQDVPRGDSVQLITPRNAWGMSGSKTYVKVPHGLRVSFVNEEVGYQKDERIVYSDGHDETSATVFEDISLWGVTKPSQVWSQGRYYLAVMLLRPEVYTATMDLEHMVCQRGDAVDVQFPSGLVGTQSGRVKNVVDDGTNITQVELDEQIDSIDGTMAMRIRRDDGTLEVFEVVGTGGYISTFSVSGVVPIGAVLEGDLAAVGEPSLETLRCIVSGIEVRDDLTARLTLTNDHPGVYTADSGTIPEFESSITEPSESPVAIPPTPTITEIWSDDAAAKKQPDGTVDWVVKASVYVPETEMPLDRLVVRFAREVDDGDGGTELLWGESQRLSPEGHEVSFPGVDPGEDIVVRAHLVSSSGVAGPYTEASHAVQGMDNETVPDAFKEVPTYEELDTGWESAGGTKQPDQPVVEVVSFIRSIRVMWDRQEDLTNLSRYEVQVTDDPEAPSNPGSVDWYAVRNDGVDWKGTLGAVSAVYDTSLFHQNIPYGGSEDDPQGRELWYRVRRRTKEDDISAWSAPVSGVTTAVSPGDVMKDAITEAKLAAESVTNAKIAAAAVEAAKLANNAVEAAKIASGAVTQAKIDSLAVTAEKIANGAVETAKLADDAVEAAKLASGSVEEAKLAANAVTETKISDGSVSTPKLVAGSVQAEKIASGAVETDKLAAGSVQAEKIAAGAVTTAKLDALAVTAEKIAAEAVLAQKLTVLARDYVNPPSITGHIRGWGNLKEDGTGSSSVNSYDDSENALRMHNTGSRSIRCQTWRMDHNKIYRVSGKAKKSADDGRYFIGAAGFSSFDSGDEGYTNGQGTENFTRFDTDRVLGATSANIYFHAVAGAPTSYVDFTYYIVGAHRDVNDCPDFVGPGSHPFVKASEEAVWMAVRFLNWENTSTTSLWIKDFSVTEVGTGQIVAENITANAITAAKIAAGAITTAKIESGAVTTAKLDSLAVTAEKVAAGAIETAKLAAGAVTSPVLAATALNWPEDAVAYWPFDEGGGDTAKDVKGGHDGTLANSPSWVAGPAGGALDFPDTGHVDFPTIELDGDFTIACWLYTRITGQHRFLNNSGHGNNGTFGGHFNTSILFFGADGSISLSKALPRDEWVFFVMTRSGSVATVFFNTEEVGQGTVTGMLRPNRWSGLSEGTYYDTYDGMIAEPRIYKRALSEAEIKTLFQFKRPGAGLVVADRIAADAVTAEKIAADAVVAENIDSGAVTAEKIETNAIKGYHIDTESLFSEDIEVGSQVRSGNYDEEGNIIDPDLAGFWFGANGKLKARNAELIGQLRSGQGVADNAMIAVADDSGIVDGPHFDGSGKNDLEILSDGAVEGTWEVEITKTGVTGYEVGDDGPAGGRIFYDKGSSGGGWRWFEARLENESGEYAWKVDETASPGTVGNEDLGDGYGNTYAMNDSDHPAANHAGSASYGGYTDWHIPSLGELEEMYYNRSLISMPWRYGGGFNPVDRYWSSSGSTTDDGKALYARRVLSGWSGTRFEVYQDPKPSEHEIRLMRLVDDEGPTKFRWRKDGGSWSSEIEIPASKTYEIPGSEIVIGFGSRIHHTVGDKWTFTQGGMMAMSIKDANGEEFFSASAGQVFYQGSPIVESGSNSDGEWTRWADGTVIANGLVSMSVDGSSGYWVGHYTPPMPTSASWSMRPMYVIRAISGSTARSTLVYSHPTSDRLAVSSHGSLSSSTPLTDFTSFASFDFLEIRWFRVGRWK